MQSDFLVFFFFFNDTSHNIGEKVKDLKSKILFITESSYVEAPIRDFKVSTFSNIIYKVPEFSALGAKHI